LTRGNGETFEEFEMSRVRILEKLVLSVLPAVVMSAATIFLALSSPNKDVATEAAWFISAVFFVADRIV
jgi:hypothetical protein